MHDMPIDVKFSFYRIKGEATGTKFAEPGPDFVYATSSHNMSITN